LVVTADGKRPFERTGLGWKDDIKVYRKENMIEGYWLDLCGLSQGPVADFGFSNKH
jgi:hypothetical protein